MHDPLRYIAMLILSTCAWHGLQSVAQQKDDDAVAVNGLIIPRDDNGM